MPHDFISECLKHWGPCAVGFGGAIAAIISIILLLIFVPYFIYFHIKTGMGNCTWKDAVGAYSIASLPFKESQPVKGYIYFTDRYAVIFVIKHFTKIKISVQAEGVLLKFRWLSRLYFHDALIPWSAIELVHSGWLGGVVRIGRPKVKTVGVSKKIFKAISHGMKAYGDA